MPEIVTGHEEVLARLAALQGDQTKKVLRDGLNAGADVVLAAIEPIAPVGKTGRLKANIKKRRAGLRKGIMRLEVGADNKDYTGPAFYTPMVAWGHKAGSRKLGDARKDVKPNDFILRGFEASKDIAVEVMVETIITGIDKITTGGG